MAEVHPFCGIRFNQNKVSDIGMVLCPPYDVISAQERRTYHDRSEYNVIRLEDGFELPGDSAQNNKYMRAGMIWNQWLQQDVLHRDSSPTFYLHRHCFPYNGEMFERTGVVACVKLEPWEKKIVLPHEKTGDNPKLDRLKLMRACHANISPILAIYEDRSRSIGNILDASQNTVPWVDALEANGERHWLWGIAGREETRIIESCFSRKKIYIADGHHRYETGLIYRDEVNISAARDTGIGADYVMMTLVELSDPGLLVLPVHRLVKGLRQDKLRELEDMLKSAFKIYSVPVEWSISRDKVNVLSQKLLCRGKSSLTIGLWGLKKGHFLMLSPRPDINYKTLMPEGHSPSYCSLAISRLQHAILDRLLSGDGEAVVSYTPDAFEAFAAVSSGESQLAFILCALQPGAIKMVAQTGDKAPRKSTYFYPKLPTGLVMRTLIGGL